MFNLFKKPVAARPHAAIGTLIDYAMNAATMSWSNLWGTIRHEQMFADRTDVALRLSAVRCAVQVYTGMAVALPRRMYAVDQMTQQSTRIIETTSHPASRLFQHYFNPELSADDALLNVIYDVLMDGNCYFIRELDTQGRTSRLYYVHPSRIPRMNIKRARGDEMLDTNPSRRAVAGEILYRIDTGATYRDKDTQPLYLPKEAMCHFKSSVLDADYFRGEGFIGNSQMTVDLYSASEQFGRNFYTRGIANQMFLTTDNRLAPEVLKRLEANFEEDPNAPLESIFKTRILEQGLKPVHMGIPFQHLQFIETRAFSVEDVARGFNIPPVLLHSYMGTKAGDVDLSGVVSLFVQTGIGPFLDRLSAQFKTELLPLPSQMLYRFEFEKMYLYRNVIDRFSDSLRKLFEIGVINRIEARQLLGLYINPSDAAADPRYVPVNLMTVEHSLLLQEQAEISNKTAKSNLEMLDLQKDGQRKMNDGMVKPVATPEAPGATTQKDMDNSPSKDNIDKRLRKANNAVRVAFNNVINGLKQYESRVLDQKKSTRPNDYDIAVTEFYAADSRFSEMLNEQLSVWAGLIDDVDVNNLIATWISSQKCPEVLDVGSES